MESLSIRITILIIYLVIGIPLAIIFNKNYNPRNHIGYRYGYFLSIITILNNILILILLYNSIFNRNYYVKATDVIEFIILSIFITFIHISISILNAKKYKIGAILISLITGTFIICYFYYIGRWHEFKNIPKIDIMKKNKFQNIKSLDYKKVLKYNSLEDYIDLFEINRLDDIEIIMSLSENDYEKIGIKILGDIKRLVNIFSKDELNKHFNEYQDNSIEKEVNENTIAVIVSNNETIDENKTTTLSGNENKNKEIEELEKLFDSTIDENEKGIIAKKLYDLGKLYYWRFIPRDKK